MPNKIAPTDDWFFLSDHTSVLHMWYDQWVGLEKGLYWNSFLRRERQPLLDRRFCSDEYCWPPVSRAPAAATGFRGVVPKDAEPHSDISYRPGLRKELWLVIRLSRSLLLCPFKPFPCQRLENFLLSELLNWGNLAFRHLPGLSFVVKFGKKSCISLMKGKRSVDQVFYNEPHDLQEMTGWRPGPCLRPRPPMRSYFSSDICDAMAQEMLSSQSAARSLTDRKYKYIQCLGSIWSSSFKNIVNLCFNMYIYTHTSLAPVYTDQEKVKERTLEFYLTLFNTSRKAAKEIPGSQLKIYNRPLDQVESKWEPDPLQSDCGRLAPPFTPMLSYNCSSLSLLKRWEHGAFLPVTSSTIPDPPEPLTHETPL